MNERQEAIALADKILDRVNTDPDDDIAVLARQLIRAEERLSPADIIVAEQANDERLWFIPVYATEAILQQALRRLHAAIEGKTPEECARAALSGTGAA